MKVTIEKVDKLVERADVSYAVAKEALDAANGDLLDAVILLEKEGKLGPGAGQKKTKVYTTDSGMPPTVIGQSYGYEAPLQTRVEPNFTAGSAGGGQGESQQAGYAGAQQNAGPHKYKDEQAGGEEYFKRFFFWLGRVIRGGCVNYFEVWRRNERVLYFPVILFLFCLIHWVFWIFLVFLFVGLLCGCRYRFSGPHLGKDSAPEEKSSESKDGEQTNP